MLEALLTWYHFQENDEYLRKHSTKNVLQHYQTLEQFKGLQDEYEDYIDWFKTLPLFYETEKFRAVHACWDEKHIAFLKSFLTDGKLNDDLIRASAIKETELHITVDETLKGKEIKMPEGLYFQDKDETAGRKYE